MSKIYRIESISQLHDSIGYSKPLHPLISFIDFSKIDKTKARANLLNVSIIMTLYSIVMKKHSSGELVYGRGTYDFEEGTLVFLGPEQVVENRDDSKSSHHEGWGLYFHPDLIRGHAIYENMQDYSFFGYESNEALHMSEREKESIENVVQAIGYEYSLNPDDYSMEIILSNLELLLGYCKRFYSRQFNTRKSVNKDVVDQFRSLLRKWYEGNFARQNGIPNVKYFAERLNYSPNYLGDLLKKETGRSTQDHIYAHIVDRAKDMLLNPDFNVAQVAYSLGFEYPQHFSKVFKKKTGYSPSDWKN
ncbi:MAG: helix-turn-helix domain-containing protein [Spirochaetota bacterium]